MAYINNKFLLAVSFIIFILAISFITNLYDFQIYSPDSIRFMHFWQNSFLLSSAQGSFLHNINDAISASHNYDLGRGRIVMYMVYGVENILLYFFNTLPQNYLIIFIICLNSHAVSILISRNIPKSKFYVYFFSFLVIAINSISLSPTMFFALYAKYICLTAILYFFVFEKAFIKIIMLLLAAFTDEIGLLLGILICFFYISRYLLIYKSSKSSDLMILSKNIIYSGIICLILMGFFFLVLFIAFDTTPLQFAKYSARGAMWLFDFEILIDRIVKLAWTIEILILGFSFENRIFLALLGFSLIISLLIQIKTLYKKNISNRGDVALKDSLSSIDFSSNQSILIFWMLVTLALIIILPSTPFSYQTYSYPMMLSLSIVVLLYAKIYLKLETFIKALAFISILHLLSIPISVENIHESNRKHFLRDKNISTKNILQLQEAIDAIRINQDYELFNKINNNQEIDYSGMWYFSLEEHWQYPFQVDNEGNCILENNIFGNCLTGNYYYPIYGTVRVASWPHFDPKKAGLHKRRFSKNKPIYNDID